MDARPLLSGEDSDIQYKSVSVTQKWRPAVEKKGLSTFMGVVVPCMISIIGVILYMRLGWAVGQAGVLGVLGMFAVGGGMALLTDLSLSAMASNGRVGAGGTYYLISRSVGPQLGGAVGIMFYAANTIGIAFYIQGFCELMSSLLQLDESDPTTYWIRVGLGTAVIVFETIINITSSGIYAKAAFLVWCVQMGTIWYGNIAALVRTPFEFHNVSDCVGLHGEVCSFYGPNIATLKANLFPDFSEGYDVSLVFGIIFPAITGIMAGTNMSGVLKRPELSIPRGELTALGWAMATYAVLVVSLGASIPREVLRVNKFILSDITWWPWALTFGILTSCMSSALASMQSASRLLQAIAQDELVPFLRFFRVTIRNEPVYALLASVSIAFCLLLIGSLDAIAPILTMFFLLTYLSTNFATLIHTVAGHPNFRPRFRYFHWGTALAGIIMCLCLMVYLQAIATVAAITIGILIALYITKQAPDTDWGEVSQSLIFHQVRKYLLRLDSGKEHVKFWRMQILCLAHSPYLRVNELEFINHMKKGGLYILGDVQLTKNSTEEEVQDGFKKYTNRREKWLQFVRESNMKAFVTVMSAASLREGISNLMLSAGLGGMRPNTLLLPFYDTFGPKPAEPIHMAQSEHARLNSMFKKSKNKLRLMESAVSWNDGLDDAMSARQQDAAVGDGEALDVMPATTGPWVGWEISELDYLKIIMDAKACSNNLLITRNFVQFDYVHIASRSKPAWAGVTAPRPRDSRHKNPEFCRIDVWDVPWGTTDSHALVLQLAHMLWDADFFHAHTYIRVCSLVESDDEALTNCHERFGSLYQQIIRDQRVRVALHMFIMDQDEPDLYQRAVDEAKASPAARDQQAPNIWDTAYWGSVSTPTLNSLPADRACHYMHEFMKRQNEGAVVTFLPLPELSPSRDAARNEVPETEEAAKKYIRHLKMLSEGLGPVMMVQGMQRVIAIDL